MRNMQRITALITSWFWGNDEAITIRDPNGPNGSGQIKAIASYQSFGDITRQLTGEAINLRVWLKFGS